MRCVRNIFTESCWGLEDAHFQDGQAGPVACRPANEMPKIIRIIFKTTEAGGMIVRNKDRLVKLLKVVNEQSERRAFIMPELKTIMNKCQG